MTRVLSAVVALPFLIVLVRFGQPVHFSGMVAAAAAVGTWEMMHLVRLPGGIVLRGLGALAGALVALGASLQPSPAVAVALLAALLLFFSSSVWLPAGSWPIPRGLPGGLIGLFFVGATFGTMTLLRYQDEGWRWVFFLWMVVWGGDTGAYYGGRAWGRHPLSPRLSPKKTVEGALTGLGSSLAGAAAARLWFLPSVGWFDVLGAALLLGAAGQIGDLTESALKRAAGVKDAGGIIPGHGGMLDRLDGLMFAAPVLYALLLLRLP